MTPIRIFISSVQSELAQEREALRDYLREDALLRRFFDVFLFEDAPASDRRCVLRTIRCPATPCWRSPCTSPNTSSGWERGLWT